MSSNPTANPPPANPANAPAAPPPPSPWKKIALGCLLMTLLVFTVICITVAVLWRQFHREPEYWQKSQSALANSDPAALARTAEEFERKLVRTTAVAAEGEAAEPVRTIHVTCDEINTWIAVKAEAWAAHQNIKLPPQIQGSMVAVEEGRLIVAFKIDTPQMQKVVSAPLDVKLNEAGMAEIKLMGLRAGDMNVPLWAVPGDVGGSNARSKEFLERAQQGFVFNPERAIDPNRILRLVGLAITSDGFDLTLKTIGQIKPKK